MPSTEEVRPTAKATTVTEVYTYTFDENSASIYNIGSNAYTDNGIYKLYDESKKEVGYIMYSSGSRYVSGDANYENYQSSLFLDNNKNVVSVSFSEATGARGQSFDNTELSVKSTFSNGKFKGNVVNVKIQFLKNKKRTVTLTYSK